ncbi:MAG: FHA domain-containing protein [Candidatus Thermoplasmatota archaeon]|nr:FHA domain-containing protein [Candidatus Thermoplasmatota archaeon]
MVSPLHRVSVHDRDRGFEINYEQLAEFLTALAYPTRLELLDQLKVPRTLGDIHVRPTRAGGGSNPDRSLSRPAVLGHLEKLMEKGLVRTDEVEKAGRQVPRYAVNPARLYALMEELRRLSVTFAGRGRGPDATGTLAGGGPVEPVEGPRLLLVHGVYEGKHFPLTAETSQAGRWVIGRSRQNPVSLDYDPYVSTENAVITQEDERFVLTDLESKNGTSVNWEPLEPGGRRTLKPGDVIGVGWSRLSFIPA